MSHTNWNDLKHKATRDQLAGARRALQEEITLAELRRAREFTQTQLAAALEVRQPAVSKIERQTDLYVSTMRSYIEALGGRLELVAVFDDGAVPIRAFEELEAERELEPA